MAQELKVYRDSKEGPCWREFYEKSEVDTVLAEKDTEIAELKNEINRKEGVGQRWFERCMEERTENVRLKRALYIVLARSFCYMRELAARNALYDDECKWDNFKTKCRAMAERYKG